MGDAARGEIIAAVAPCLPIVGSVLGGNIGGGAVSPPLPPPKTLAISSALV